MAKTKIQSFNARTDRTWAANHGTYIAGRAYLDEADLTAHDMERKWGVDRLRLLVGPELREKFDRQRYLFNQAVWHGRELEDVKREAGRMVKAWYALDKAATEAGRTLADPGVIEIPLSDGSIAAIVTGNAPYQQADGRQVTVYGTDEIARLLEGYPTLAKIKDTFPGAEVVAVRSVRDPLDAFFTSKPALNEPMIEDEIENLFGVG